MTQTAPAGWYPDPENPTQQRYWDGAAWAQNVTPTLPPEDGPQGLAYPEDTQQPVVDVPVLQTWKTSVGFSILGLLVGLPLLLGFSALLVELVTRSDAQQPLLRVVVALILMSIYAAKFYPSYFTEKPLLKSNRAISFANIMFGAWAGFSWNGNLTKKTKGTSNVRFIVGNALVCALLAFAIFGALRFGGISNSTSTPSSPSAPLAPSVAVTPTPPAFAPPAKWSVQPLKRTGDANIYTDAETGVSFVIPDTWSEQPPSAVDQESKAAKFRIPDPGGTAFFWSVAESNYRMDDSSEKRIYEVWKKSVSDATVARASLNGVEYFVVSGNGTDTATGQGAYSVYLIRVQNGRMFGFQYVKFAGSSEDEYLQTFFSMVASTVYP